MLFGDVSVMKMTNPSKRQCDVEVERIQNSKSKVCIPTPFIKLWTLIFTPKKKKGILQPPPVNCFEY